MSQQKRDKKQTGRVNYVWVLGGGYLIYTAIQLFRNLPQAPQPTVNIIGGTVFTVAGAWMLWREWKAYRYGVEHMDDPDSWSDEPEQPEQTGQPAEKEEEGRP